MTGLAFFPSSLFRDEIAAQPKNPNAELGFLWHKNTTTHRDSSEHQNATSDAFLPGSSRATKI